MKILLLGGHGMLGSELSLLLPDALRPTAEAFDISNPEHVATVAVDKHDIVINCAAYTAVDRAEEDRDLAFAINGVGPALLARACAMAGTPLIHISTDYVFDGTASTPYTEDSQTNPTSVYGESKLAGEEGVRAAHQAHWIIRTSWLFGPFGACFPRAILNRAMQDLPLRVVDDQIGCPTPTRLVAEAILRLIEPGARSSLRIGIEDFNSPPFGTYHVCGNEMMSWYDLAHRTLTAADISQPIEQIQTADWPTPAVRPKYSVLDTTKAREAGIYPEVPLDAELRRCVEHWNEAR